MSGLLILVLAEGVSWCLSSLPPKAANETADYSPYYNCASDGGILWCDTQNLFSWIGQGDHLTAVSTAVIAAFTIILACIGKTTDRNFRQAERAYVKISHESKPGLPGLLIGNDGSVLVSLEIRNHGRTPAMVTDVVVAIDQMATGQVLAEKPLYRRQGGAGVAEAFLVADDSIFYPVSGALDEPQLAAVRSGAITLVVYGYVDYIDAFGVPHRGGYARTYDRNREGNNLIFVNKPNYNYDRTRVRGTPGEVEDWNQKQT